MRKLADVLHALIYLHKIGLSNIQIPLTNNKLVADQPSKFRIKNNQVYKS